MTALQQNLAALLQAIFGTDQKSHLVQQPDGKYIKVAGSLTAKVIEKSLESHGSLGSYQKNQDNSINWICFDFDVDKDYVDSPRFEEATKQLRTLVEDFCNRIGNLAIPYLLEFSGNRGMHVWIIFSERLDFRLGYEISESIIRATELSFDHSLINLDRFPASRTPTYNVGLGVKIPASRHTKSKCYSLLIQEVKDLTISPVNSLTDCIIRDQIKILENCKKISKTELEVRLDDIFEVTQDFENKPLRIKSINLTKNKILFDEIISLWRQHAPLAKLADRILIENDLDNAERKLLVGMLINVRMEKDPAFSTKLLLQIFSKTKNYDEVKSRRAITLLSSFHFPSPQQIEQVTNEKFDHDLNITELLQACIPHFAAYIDGSLELLTDDIEVCRNAELNYLFQNDEVYSSKVINQLSNRDGREYLREFHQSLLVPQSFDYYVHCRNEPNKQRTLITLGASQRLLTSTILKQLIYLFDYRSSVNSFGYRVNRGFKDGYIFKPWLYLWIEFVTDISSVIEDISNRDYFIVKTDISRFYDAIPHEPLKRLLMGGVNKKIDDGLSRLASTNSKEQYQKFIDLLFFTTTNLVASGFGLPQGPAYARFLAELYLDNIDLSFDGEIASGGVQFYHRYVDDIFYICKTESEARRRLDQLREQLGVLGLEVNDEKTQISRIADFTSDFEEYRSQSKYAVDKTSKNFEDATDSQKNVAISGFMKLVQSDSFADDLAFIFSHLAGVPELDAIKQEKLLPVLQSGVGRGSLFRHMFNFILDKSERWQLFEQIDNFSPLQSEVLTSTIVTFVSSPGTDWLAIQTLIDTIVPKLSTTPLVEENLVFLSVQYNVDIGKMRAKPEAILDCIASCPDPMKLTLTKEILDIVNLNLNSEQSLPRFVERMYPISVCPATPKQSLNQLAQVFFAKLANDYAKKRLTIDSYEMMQSEPVALRFYHLLCLFSLSEQGKSLPVLKEAWKYCATIFNNGEISTASLRSDNWFSRLSDIEMSGAKANLVLASIVDGNIFRGVQDQKQIFGLFHSLIIIFIAKNVSFVPLDSLKQVLDDLTTKADFYKWILEADGVSLFPKQSWFEKNALENNCIMLKKESQILIRKPVFDFVDQKELKNVHNGYGERIERYDPSTLDAFKSALNGLSLSGKLGAVLRLILRYPSGVGLPNIFCEENLIRQPELSAFTAELDGLPVLLHESETGVITSYANTADNFLSCFFNHDFSGNDNKNFRLVREKYIKNLPSSIELIAFVRAAKAQLEQISGVENAFYIDLAMASALYQCLQDERDDKKITKFVDGYHKFNKTDDERHAYCIDLGTPSDDSSPITTINTVIKSLITVVSEVVPSFTFYLGSDVKMYLSRVERIAAVAKDLGYSIDFSEFKKARIDPRHMQRIVNYGGAIEYKFENVLIANAATSMLEPFETQRHDVYLRSSEHAYVTEQAGKLIVFAVDPSISKIFVSIQSREQKMSKKGMERRSFPQISQSEISVDLRNLTKAKTNIAIHRGVSEEDAFQILNKWLIGLPVRFHQALTSLIAAHTVMTSAEIDAFVDRVEQLISCTPSSAFLIKRMGDFNGTHRILCRNTDVARKIEKAQPIGIAPAAIEATLIVDNVISGSQIIKALKFYALGEGKDPNYFMCDEKERKEVAKRLLSLKMLRICQVFYTASGISCIEEECRKFLNPQIRVEAFEGRDIENSAIFGTSEMIGEKDKNEIRALCEDKEAFAELLNHLSIAQKSAFRDFSSQKIDHVNLVARYQSLPKRCFYFLHSGLMHSPNGAPFQRIFEAYEN